VSSDLQLRQGFEKTLKDAAPYEHKAGTEMTDLNACTLPLGIGHGVHDVFGRYFFRRVEPATHIEIVLEQLEDIITIESNIGVDEHEMSRLRIMHHGCNDIVARPRYQTIRVCIERESQVSLGAFPGQVDETAECIAGDLACVARDAEMDQHVFEQRSLSSRLGLMVREHYVSFRSGHVRGNLMQSRVCPGLRLMIKGKQTR
jgi:hypothetical protein